MTYNCRMEWEIVLTSCVIGAATQLIQKIQNPRTSLRTLIAKSLLGGLVGAASSLGGLAIGMEPVQTIYASVIFAAWVGSGWLDSGGKSGG
jgi:hypothetical protein